MFLELADRCLLLGQPQAKKPNARVERRARRPLGKHGSFVLVATQPIEGTVDDPQQVLVDYGGLLYEGQESLSQHTCWVPTCGRYVLSLASTVMFAALC